MSFTGRMECSKANEKRSGKLHGSFTSVTKKELASLVNLAGLIFANCSRTNDSFNFKPSLTPEYH